MSAYLDDEYDFSITVKYNYSRSFARACVSAEPAFLVCAPHTDRRLAALLVGSCRLVEPRRRYPGPLPGRDDGDGCAVDRWTLVAIGAGDQQHQPSERHVALAS